MRSSWTFGLLGVALLGTGCSPSLPTFVRAEMDRTKSTNPGASTVVFFTDFQCPHCRRTHAALSAAMASRPGRVRIVLRHVPLPRHPDARAAARAAVCVERLAGALTTDFADALFASTDLSEATCEALAVERGVDPTKLRRCLSDPGTDARIDADSADFDAIGGDGVPLLFVGATRLEGGQSVSTLTSALDAARVR